MDLRIQKQLCTTMSALGIQSAIILEESWLYSYWLSQNLTFSVLPSGARDEILYSKSQRFMKKVDSCTYSWIPTEIEYSHGQFKFLCFWDSESISAESFRITWRSYVFLF